MTKAIATLCILAAVSCAPAGTRQQSADVIESSRSRWKTSSGTSWLSDEGLLNVESIVYDEFNQVFYVSNGLAYKQGVSGYITRVENNGASLELRWVDKLNRPTGMAIRDSILYVADVHVLLAINTNTGTIENVYQEPLPNSGLNDVAVGPDGRVFVTASAAHAVFELVGDSLSEFLQDEHQLRWANGILTDDNKVWIAGLELSSISLHDSVLSSVHPPLSIRDFDGMASDGKGGLFLTTVEKSGLYHLNNAYEVTKLLEGEDYFGDIWFDTVRKHLYVPRGNKERQEFYITRLSLTDSILD